MHCRSLYVYKRNLFSAISHQSKNFRFYGEVSVSLDQNTLEIILQFRNSSKYYFRCNSGIAANTISDTISVVRLARIIKFWCKVIINIGVIICHYLPQYQYLKMKLYYIKDKAYKSFVYKITRNILNKCVFKMIF